MPRAEKVKRGDYETMLDELQMGLINMHYSLRPNSKKFVAVFEGRVAAGKRAPSRPFLSRTQRRDLVNNGGT
jgi:polyphosphate kinase 2 (PPK2 family)